MTRETWSENERDGVKGVDCLPLGPEEVVSVTGIYRSDSRLGIKVRIPRPSGVWSVSPEQGARETSFEGGCRTEDDLFWYTVVHPPPRPPAGRRVVGSWEELQTRGRVLRSTVPEAPLEGRWGRGWGRRGPGVDSEGTPTPSVRFVCGKDRVRAEYGWTVRPGRKSGQNVYSLRPTNLHHHIREPESVLPVSVGLGVPCRWGFRGRTLVSQKISCVVHGLGYNWKGDLLTRVTSERRRSGSYPSLSTVVCRTVC